MTDRKVVVVEGWKSTLFKFLSHQSPRVLVALSALGLLGWFGWKDKISEWPLMIGIAAVAVSFQFFNYLVVGVKGKE